MAEPYMTVDQINAKFPNEWVFITNPTTRGRSLAPTGGIVVFHSPDRAEFLRPVGEWDDPSVRDTASWYTGKDRVEEIEWIETEPGAA
jgi:hypothetical protein